MCVCVCLYAHGGSAQAAWDRFPLNAVVGVAGRTAATVKATLAGHIPDVRGVLCLGSRNSFSLTLSSLQNL